MPTPIPRWDPRNLVALWTLGLRPSPCFRRVGSHIALFEACSAFTRVSACTFAESPNGDPLHRRLRWLRLLHHRSDCYRPERPVAGWDSHPLKIAAFSRRTETPGSLSFALRATGGLNFPWGQLNLP